MDADFTECLLLYRSGKSADCIGKLLNFLARQPSDLDALFLLGLISSGPAPSDPSNGIFDGLLLPDRRTAAKATR